MDPLAVVVHGNGQFLLGGLLPDHVLIQEFLDFQRLWDPVGDSGRWLGFIVLQDGVAHRDAFVTYISAGVIARGGDELSDYVLALMTKRAS